MCPFFGDADPKGKMFNPAMRSMAGTQLEATVLFEDDVENGWMHGFTENYIRVTAKYDPMLINELKKVKLTEINEQGFMEVEEVGSFVHHH